MTLQRHTPLRADPAKVLAWQRRSRKPLSSVGRRGKAEASAVAHFRTEVRKRARGLCEIVTPSCPPGQHRGAHAHHIKTRAQGGGHDPSNGLYLCGMAHLYVHANPAESYLNGWMIPNGKGVA